MEEKIVFRTRDIEGDYWAESAFIFNSYDDSDRFFKYDNPQLLSLFCAENETFDNFEISINESTGHVFHIVLESEYAGKVEIVEMSEAYIIN